MKGLSVPSVEESEKKNVVLFAGGFSAAHAKMERPATDVLMSVAKIV
jgi:hypothetical protein